MTGTNESKTVRAGASTFFLDFKETREGKRYLLITESRFKGEGKKQERTSMAIFPEYAGAFRDVVQEMVDGLR